MADTLNNLYDELEYLAEVDPGSLRIAEIQFELKELHNIGSRWG